MRVRPSVAEICSRHVTLELQSIDRMYLNLYVPLLWDAQTLQFVAPRLCDVKDVDSSLFMMC